MPDMVLKGLMDGAKAFAGPETVQFDITNRCNNTCLCCWNNSPLLGTLSADELRDRQQELPYDLVVRTIDELAAMGTKRLFFAGGGEPFMHPHCMDILRHAKTKGLEVHMNTNFTLVDTAMARDLVTMKVDHIRVSLLAGTRETYAQVHPNKDAAVFDRIISVLQAVADLKRTMDQHLGGPDRPSGPLPHIGVHYVLFNKNYHELRQMINVAMAVKADSVEFPLIDVIPGKTDVLLLSKEQLATIAATVPAEFRRLEAYNRDEPVKIAIINREMLLERVCASSASHGTYEESLVTRQPCYVGWGFLRVLGSGEVNSCLKSHRYPIGNIYKTPIRDLWNNEAQQLFRRKTLAFDVRDGFFRLIGNDPASAAGCMKSCDNIQMNIDMHAKYGEVLKKYGKIST